MKLFPAVDILDGKAVRLLEGKRDMLSVYGNPLDMAHKWADMGAQYIHIVDLNSAFGEKGKNTEILKAIAKEITITLELGGGMRTREDVDYAIEELGFSRAVIGSSLVTNPEIIDEISKYGDKIVGGLDARDGKLFIKGWVEQTSKTPLEVALRLKESGITDIVYTDIARDGKMTGANTHLTKELQEKSRMNIIASGGVSKIEDLLELKSKGIYGAIIGKALYENTIDLREALSLC